MNYIDELCELIYADNFVHETDCVAKRLLDFLKTLNEQEQQNLLDDVLLYTWDAGHDDGYKTRDNEGE